MYNAAQHACGATRNASKYLMAIKSAPSLDRCYEIGIWARLVFGRVVPECLWKVLFSDWISINTRQIMPINSAKMHHLQQQWRWLRGNTASAAGPIDTGDVPVSQHPWLLWPTQGHGKQFTPRPCPYWCFWQQRRSAAATDTRSTNNNTCSYIKTSSVFPILSLVNDTRLSCLCF